MGKQTASYDEEAELRKMTEVDLDADEEQGGSEVAMRGGMMKVGGNWSTAVSNIESRNPRERAKMLVAEAREAGESFFYGWGAGKNRIEGASIGLAMAAARIWGNCAVDFKEMQETEDSWVFTSYFIDLQTGFTLGRQFRQSKKSTVHGKHDAERKDDMRFQIGQSKAARNVVLNALPKWMIKQAVNAAKEGVRNRIAAYIEKINAGGGNGMLAAVDLCMKGLQKHGVTEEAVLDKFDKTDLAGLLLDDIVVMRGDLYALDESQDRAESLYPLLKEAAGKAKGGGTASSVNDKLKDAGGDAGGTASGKQELPAFDWPACESAFAKMETVAAVRSLFTELTGPQSKQGFNIAERTKIQNLALTAEARLNDAATRLAANAPKETKAEAKQEPKAETKSEPAKQPEKSAADTLDSISSSGEPSGDEGFQLGKEPKEPKGNGKKK